MVARMGFEMGRRCWYVSTTANSPKANTFNCSVTMVGM